MKNADKFFYGMRLVLLVVIVVGSIAVIVDYFIHPKRHDCRYECQLQCMQIDE